MKLAQLKSYGENLKTIAKATSRNQQMNEIRQRTFRATLVDDPLSSRDELTFAIEAARMRIGS